LGRTGLETVEAGIDIGEPVAAFGIFALIDDIETDFTLPRDNISNVLAQRGVILAAVTIGAIRSRQTADMGGENLAAAASLHVVSISAAPTRNLPTRTLLRPVSESAQAP
jgi:hypothetical protein